MRPSENFARQHGDLLALAASVTQALSNPAWKEEPSDVMRLMAQFTGKLSVHAAMETDALYPRLLQHPDAAVRTQAKALLDEVGGLYDEFNVFARQWKSVDAVRAEPDVYAGHVTRLFKVLGRRMVRENKELYPLADAHLAA